MSKNSANPYKMCRETTAITQEQAAELLAVSVRTLSAYENGHTTVPDDMVKKMVEVYNTPLIAWWHLKNTSLLGEYLPDVAPPQSYSDMAFQLILAQDDLDPTVDTIKRILYDGVVDSTEETDYKAAIDRIKTINAKLLSVIIFAQNK